LCRLAAWDGCKAGAGCSASSGESDEEARHPRAAPCQCAEQPQGLRGARTELECRGGGHI